MSDDKKDFRRKQPRKLKDVRYMSLKVYLKSYKKFKSVYKDVKITDFIDEKLLFKLERRYPKVFTDEATDEEIER